MNTSLYIPPREAGVEPASFGTVQHAISTVRINRPATIRNRQLLEIFGLPIIGIHGQYQQLGLYQTISQLSALQRRAIAAVLKENKEPATAIEDFSACAVAVQSLQDTCRPIAQSLLQALVNSVIREPGYIEQIVNRYDTAGDTGAPLSQNNCTHRRDHLNQCLEAPGVAETLRDVIERYDRRIAEFVIKGVLDVPLTPPNDEESYPNLQHLGEIDLKNRLSTVINRLDATVATSGDTTQTAVVAEIRRAIDTETGLAVSGNGFQNNDRGYTPDVPLIAVANTWAAESSIALGDIADPQLRTSFGRIVERIFRIGGIGALIYQLEDGTPNWLVNPWIADTPVNEGGRVYDEAWQYGYFLGQIGAQLLEKAQTGFPISPLECPLCKISNGTCGESRCRCQPDLATLNRQLHKLVRYVQSYLPS